MKQCIYVILFFFGNVASIQAQSKKTSDVYKTLKANDSLIFERAFNKCETQHLEYLIADDLEFYHDKAGLINSKDAFIKGMKQGICDPTRLTKSSRELVGELEVFPLYNNGVLYGALQNSIHSFFETTNGKVATGSTAKFSHLWILENNKWMLKRVISFDHQMQQQ